MEKFIFLATIKDRLTELNLPKETVEKHVKLFEDCFKGKSADEIDKVIDGAGGIDGIVKSITNLEAAKSPKSNDPKNNVDPDVSEEDVKVAPSTETADNEVIEQVEKQEELAETVESAELIDTENFTEDADCKNATIEIKTNPDIDKHIKEAEELTETLERISIPQTNDMDVEYAEELSDYDFETLFAEKLSLPEKWIKNLKEKMSPKTFKTTLPLSILVDVILLLFVIVLFPILFASAIIFSALYLATLVSGLCFAIVPIVYGVYMCFHSMPVALYELGIGIIALGATMLSSILLYNYVKRLVPFLFKQLKKLFKFWVKLTKRYFGKTVKEEN